MHLSRRSSTGALAALLAAAALVCACANQAPDHGAHAYALLQEGRWDEAAEAAKQQLLARPADVAAHFILGRCYLNGPNFYPGAAEGEFKIALDLFNQNGQKSPIGEYNDMYFELRCHLELAKVHLRRYYQLAGHGAPKRLLNKPRRELQKEAKAAAEIAPGSEDVQELKAIVEAL